MKRGFLTVIFLMSLCLANAAASGTGHPENASSESLPGRRVTFAPFYLLHEKAGKVWIERVFVTIEGPGVSAALDQPRLRSLLFETLVSEPEEWARPDKVRSALEQSLGRAAVDAVHLSGCYLLF